MSNETLTESQARQLANEIRGNLVDLEKNLKYFHAVQGWFPLGYDSFTVWWDNEMRDLPIATGIRNWAIYMMLEENTEPSGRTTRGMVGVMAHATGLAPNTITAMKFKARRRPRVTRFGKSDSDPAALSITIPTRWHRHLIALSVKKDRPMADFLRPIIKDGMLEKHGIDLDADPFAE